jgi:hypothetical protein
MADIKLEDLAINNKIGADLFSDSESFLKEISDESEEVHGGLAAATPGCILPTCEVTLEGCWKGSLVNTVFAV